MTNEDGIDFILAANKLQKAIHENAVAHGWWDDDRSDGELLALIHSEVSEALEVLREDPHRESDKDRTLLAVEEELADVMIRIMDMAQARGWDVARAMIAKHRVNKGRPHRHGGKRF